MENPQAGEQAAAWQPEPEATDPTGDATGDSTDQTEPSSEATDPTETTQPPDTEPTEPVPVKKDVTFTLPELTEETQVDICQAGETVHSRTVSAGTKSIVVSLVGTGTQYFEVVINGEVYSSVEVVFTTDE